MSRRRFIFRPDPDTGEVVSVEVTRDWSDAETRAPVATEGIAYSNLRATDGTPIDSRAKHREYMRAHGVALQSDFNPETIAREKAFAEQQEDRRRRDTVGRAAYELESSRGARLTEQLHARQARREAIWRDIQRKGGG